MKRNLMVLLAIVVALPAITFAQGEPGWNKMSLGANAEVSVPVGDFSTIAGIGYGGNVRYQYGGDLRGVLTLTAGYLVWGKKDLGGNTTIQSKAFSVFVGGKYYFANGFFGTVEGGAYFMSYTYEGNVVGAEGNTGRFMLPIGLGFQKSGFEVGARYMLLATDFNTFSFTLGYNFML